MANGILDLATKGVSASASGAANSAAIAAALADFNTAGGGYAVLGPGYFDIAAPVILPAKVSLVGSGARRTVLVATVAMDSIVKIIGGDNVNDFRSGHRVENLYIGGNSNAQCGILLDYVSLGNVFRNLYIRDCLEAGIKTIAQREDFSGGCWSNTFDNVQVEYCARGVVLLQASNLTRLTNCVFRYNYGAGIYTETCTALNIIGCSIESNGSAGVEQIGIKILGGHASLISGCYFEGNGAGAGVDIVTGATAWGGVDGLTLFGCYFNGLEYLDGEGAVSTPAKTLHALNVSQGTVSVIGGYSNRHSGTATVLGTGGAINNNGFVVADHAGVAV